VSIPQPLAKAAAAKGLNVVDMGSGHFQITGGTALVNYWPWSKRLTAYVDGDRNGKRGVTPKQAVELAGPAKATVLPAVRRPAVRDALGRRENKPEGWPELGLAKFYFGKRGRVNA